ncbi:type VII secretion-associated serine protease [Streptomyces lavendofoliae]|uniref:Type VII secretion-associated serine protease n=1 Tax=Streptomyces lavendofoliae TaxID=67314 RepID=A0A918I523_9ACTN|nr:type VII secretion-associated serine protease [Streptomyces lavendofoliae]
MSHVSKRAGLYGRRHRMLCAAAATAAWAVIMSGTATAATITDPQSRQWYLDAMKADEIWKSATGEGIKVAVIDSGVDPTTPSLQGQVLGGRDLTGVKGEATDDFDGHGTSMAELIAGTGKGGGLKGLAPGAKIIPLRVSDTELQNKEKVNAFDMQEAIRAAADSDAKIISVSMGSEFYSSEERDAVEYAQGKGKLLFAGVGNSAKKGNKPQYPASYPEAVAVAGSSTDGEVSDYSQHGDFVDIAAPADDIPGWCDEKLDAYCDGNGGTSAATAIASASAALIWSKHPEWTGNQVLRVMFESAGRGKDWKPGTVSNFLGHGIVRPGAHINRGLGKPGAPDISPLTNEKVGGVTAGSATSPAPSAPASSQAPKGKPGSDAAVAGSSEKAGADGGGGNAGLVIGGAAAVVVVAGAAFAVARRRRSA